MNTKTKGTMPTEPAAPSARPLSPEDVDALRQAFVLASVGPEDVKARFLATVDALAAAMVAEWRTPRGHVVISGPLGRAVELADGRWHVDPMGRPGADEAGLEVASREDAVSLIAPASCQRRGPAPIDALAPERWASIRAHAARHEAEGFADNDVSTLLAVLATRDAEVARLTADNVVMHDICSKQHEALERERSPAFKILERDHPWAVKLDAAEARAARAEAKSDEEMLRVKACEHIAEGDEGWERLRDTCPSTAAVAALRDALTRAEADAERLRQAEKDAEWHRGELEKHLGDHVYEAGKHLDPSPRCVAAMALRARMRIDFLAAKNNEMRLEAEASRVTVDARVTALEAQLAVMREEFEYTAVRTLDDGTSCWCEDPHDRKKRVDESHDEDCQRARASLAPGAGVALRRVLAVVYGFEPWVRRCATAIRLGDPTQILCGTANDGGRDIGMTHAQARELVAALDALKE